MILEVGGLVDESGVGLAIYGRDLDPEDVTTRLGCRPTHAHRRGDTKRPGGIPFQSGGWFLEERGRAPDGPEQLIRRLLDRLPTTPSIWKALSEDYDIQLRFGIHFNGWNKGFVLPANLLATLAMMHVSLSFDLYAYGEGED
jgi:hypothetical protein